jgi:hypothetical protein
VQEHYNTTIDMFRYTKGAAGSGDFYLPTWMKPPVSRAVTARETAPN